MDKPSLAKFYCRYLQQRGFCRFNEPCLFSHSRSALKIPEHVCIYFFKNPSSCRYADCNFLHISPDELIAQLRVLENYDNHNCRRHRDNESSTSRAASECERSKSAFNKRNFDRRKNDGLKKPNETARVERLCGVCLEDIIGSKRFGLLPNCNHIFCYDCIMTWRKTKNPADGSQLSKACPECRAPSDYVVPSRCYAVDDSKKRIIEQYKDNRKDIPCKFEKNGTNNCRFEESCFFKHSLPFQTFVSRGPRFSYSIHHANLILNTFLDSDDEEVSISILADAFNF